MMQDGYTAAEALGALAMIGLTVGGVAASLMTLGRVQNATRGDLDDAIRIRTAQSALEAVLKDRGPFRSDKPTAFWGDARGFQFECSATQACSARVEGADLVVRGPAGVRIIKRLGRAPLTFTYVGPRGPADSWPPVSTGAQAVEMLAAVSLLSADGKPAAVVPTPIGQAVGCQYDVIVRDCHGVQP